MSTSFTVVCETCDEVGPTIRRHHDKGVLMMQDSARFFPAYDPDQAALDWGSFLIKHQYHHLALVTEHSSKIAQAMRERERAEAEATRPRFRLLDDGGLEPVA